MFNTFLQFTTLFSSSERARNLLYYIVCGIRGKEADFSRMAGKLRRLNEKEKVSVIPKNNHYSSKQC